MFPKTILVIDEDDNLRHTLTIILQRAGYRVIATGFIYKAEECLSSGNFDLVLLDLKMPNGEDLNFLSTMRCSYPELPVIILSAYPSNETKSKLIDEKSLNLYIKPLEPDFILNRVQEILEETK